MSIVGSRSTHPLGVSILVVDQVPVVRLLGEWYQHVPILPPSTLPFGLFIAIGMAVAVAAYVPEIDCPTRVGNNTDNKRANFFFSGFPF